MTPAILPTDLIPVLTWLHSKKHDEKRLDGPWHLAWDEMGALLADGADYSPVAFEHSVHEAIGIPTEDCQCEVCSPAGVA